jgi:glycosyltransferase involved in cell wall biosynthesis
MLEEVLPRVWAELPDTKLALVGAGLELPAGTDPRVEARGFVEDLRDAYATASCAVVPLLVGGGTPLKLIEALAYGLPVVATPRAVAGLAIESGVNGLVADGPEAFAAELTRVLRDGAEEVARRGRALAAERYSIAALSELLDV